MKGERRTAGESGVTVICVGEDGLGGRAGGWVKA